jgi:hypothetical protein
MKNAFDKQDLFNLCVIKTAKLRWKDFDLDNLDWERHAREVIANDLLFDIFRRQLAEISFSASFIIDMVGEYRKRGVFVESTDVVLEWLEYCVLHYRFEREEKLLHSSKREEFDHLVNICGQNFLAYLLGINKGYFEIK